MKDEIQLLRGKDKIWYVLSFSLVGDEGHWEVWELGKPIYPGKV